MVKFIVNYFIYCPRNNFSAQRYDFFLELANFCVLKKNHHQSKTHPAISNATI